MTVSIQNDYRFRLFFTFLWLLHFIIVNFKHKRSPVPAALAEVHLTHVSARDGKDITAFTDRTAQHSQQLYMTIRYKN